MKKILRSFHIEFIHSFPRLRLITGLLIWKYSRFFTAEFQKPEIPHFIRNSIALRQQHYIAPTEYIQHCLNHDHDAELDFPSKEIIKISRIFAQSKKN